MLGRKHSARAQLFSVNPDHFLKGLVRSCEGNCIPVKTSRVYEFGPMLRFFYSVPLTYVSIHEYSCYRYILSLKIG